MRAPWPSESVTDRVLNATGREHAPADLNAAALRADLRECRISFLLKRSSSAAYQSSHRAAASQIIKHGKGLREALTANALLLRELQFAIAPSPGDEHFFSVLTDVIDAAERILREDAKSSPSGGQKEYLVTLLIPIYERHFCQAASCAHADDGTTPTGPFVQFVEAVASRMENKLHVSPHTVESALKAFRRHATDDGAAG
jgi:hypothetical protein